MKKITTYLAGFLFLLLSVSVFGQINTPAGATWPFGSRIQQFPNPYNFGIVPSNLPTGAYNPASNQYGKSQDAYDAYVEWKSCYVYDCGTESRVRFDNAVETVSEGIGYGMLLAAYAADRNLVEELWRYYINRRNPRGLMNWRIGNGSATACGTTVNGNNGATDSEVDVAMALIVAACQWPTYTFSGTNGTATGTASGRTFAQEASYLIGQIRQFEITVAGCAGAAADYQISNGDGWINGCPGTHTCRNPSYQAPAYVKLYQAYDAAAAAGFWTTNVYGTIYTEILNPNRNTTTGLVSNWCSPAGVANTCATPAFLDHGYDAIRNPWRMATDYIWHGDANARTNFCQPLSNYIRTQTATYTNAPALRGPVTQAGAYIGGRTTASPDATFTSMWGCGAMGVDYTANNQSTLDFMYNRVRVVKDPLNCTAGSSTGYFGNTLRVISLFMMTGNFWKPCPPRCQTPYFAVDSVSTCGETSITLNSGLATGGSRTFQWFKNGTSLAAASGSANTLVVNATSPAPAGPGWFRVKVDTTGGCTQSDSIYVKSTAVTPNLGATKTLCTNGSITLNAGLYSATGYTFVWEFAEDFVYANLGVVPGQTGLTYTNVRRAGLYKVSATKGGCTTLWDTVRVVSSLINPVDNCITASSGTVTLGVGGPNLGLATNYDWYSSAIGGSPMTSGTPNPATNTITWTTPTLSTGTYTYYVQDKSRQYGQVGKSAPTSPPADCGSFSMNADGITPGWGVDGGNIYSQDWTVTRTINIDSVTIWFCLYNNTDIFLAANNVTFRLTDATGATTVQTTAARPAVRLVNTVASYGPPYNGRVQGVRYYVGFNNVAAGTYRIKVLTPTAGFNMLLEQHPTNVYYNYYDNIDGSTAYIRSSFGYSTTFGNRYAHFYDWTISTLNNCARVPVIAYVGSCPAGLPMELISFDGKAYQGYNKLSWITATETNTDYFLIERAGEDGNYHIVDRVEAAGNSSTIKEYEFYDRSPLSGGGYYRLVQYDLDGKKYQSHTIYIGEFQSDKVSLFPNPANTQITIRSVMEGSEFSSVEVYDVFGKQVILAPGNSSERSIDISALSTGVYTVRITFNGTTETIRLLKN